MIRLIYERLTKSTVKWWLMMGGLLGVGMLPCPECGTTMIFHVWPLAGIVLVVRMMKKRYHEKGQGDSETAPAKPWSQVSISGHEDRCDLDAKQSFLVVCLNDYIDKKGD